MMMKLILKEKMKMMMTLRLILMIKTRVEMMETIKKMTQCLEKLKVKSNY